MSENMQESDGMQATKTGLEIGAMGSARLTERDEWWTRAHQLGVLLERYVRYKLVCGKRR